jgi:hypothetical protein
MPASLAAIALLVALAAPAAPVKPWEEEGDVGCHWWLSGPDGREHRASIGQGDDDPVLSISDRAFLPFTEEMRVPLTVRVDGNRKRSFTASAWSSSIVGDGERMMGMFLDARARRALGAARRLEVIHAGKVLVDIPLAKTPSRAMLDKCTRPKGLKGDQE